MQVRPYCDTDLGAVLELHRRQGLDYALPDLDKMAVGCVIEEGQHITHALFLRPTCEAYWMFRPDAEWKRQTLARLLVLHKEVIPAAVAVGFEDIHCWIPPTVLDKKLHGTMLKLGWEQPLWTCYRRDIAPVEVVSG